MKTKKQNKRKKNKNKQSGGLFMMEAMGIKAGTFLYFLWMAAWSQIIVSGTVYTAKKTWKLFHSTSEYKESMQNMEQLYFAVISKIKSNLALIPGLQDEYNNRIKTIQLMKEQIEASDKDDINNKQNMNIINDTLNNVESRLLLLENHKDMLTTMMGRYEEEILLNRRTLNQMNSLTKKQTDMGILYDRLACALQEKGFDAVNNPELRKLFRDKDLLESIYSKLEENGLLGNLSEISKSVDDDGNIIGDKNIESLGKINEIIISEISVEFLQMVESGRIVDYKQKYEDCKSEINDILKGDHKNKRLYTELEKYKKENEELKEKLEKKSTKSDTRYGIQKEDGTIGGMNDVQAAALERMKKGMTDKDIEKAESFEIVAELI